jgi:putative membrane protein
VQILLRLLINAAALWLATRLVDGITFTGDWLTLLLVALLFGLLNVLVRPILKLLTFPLLILSLGLFTFVLNAFMLWLTAQISDAADLGFHVSGFRAAFIGALLVTVVSFVLSLAIRPGRSRDDR